MKLLLDTQLLLWAANDSRRLSEAARAAIADPANALVFSVASIWDVAIKRALGRPDFQTDSRVLRRALIENGYEDLAVLGRHAVAVEALPALHKDPFDRLLVAQATVEGILLLTADPIVATYPGPIRKV